jgi:hypothetical protein
MQNTGIETNNCENQPAIEHVGKYDYDWCGFERF